MGPCFLRTGISGSNANRSRKAVRIEETIHKSARLFLVSYFCCNELLQVQWFKATHIYSLLVLEVKSLKWVCRTVFLLEMLGKNQFLPFPVPRSPMFFASQVTLTSVFILISPSLTVVFLSPSSHPVSRSDPL